MRHRREVEVNSRASKGISVRPATVPFMERDVCVSQAGPVAAGGATHGALESNTGRGVLWSEALRLIPLRRGGIQPRTGKVRKIASPGRKMFWIISLIVYARAHRLTNL